MNFLKKQFQRTRIKREIDEELRFHMEQRTVENVANGMAPEDAAREARKRFGNLQSIREECRGVHSASFGEEAVHDLRFGLRMLRKNPGFTVVAVLTLAFGIGVNTAIFTLINTVLFKPVMAQRPDQLVSVYQQSRDGQSLGQWRHFSYPDFIDLRADKNIFANLAVVDDARVGVHDHGLNEMVPTVLVSANYFSLLGVSPVLGRGFESDEETAASPVAVLTHAFWERLGSDPAIVGQTLKLSRGFATIVGVMPRGFTGDRLVSPAFFLSLGAEDALNLQPGQASTHILTDRAQRHFSITGRLKSGLDLKTAGGALSVLNGHFPLADPNESQERTLLCTPLVRFDYHEMPEQLERQAVPFGLLAQGMTLLILFIACLNLANMMLARGAARQKEIAVRMSLGAGRGRILRQLLTEGLLLASLGGVAGVFVSNWAAHFLGAVVAGRLGVELPTRGTLMDWRLFGALSAFSFVATLFFALGPAWRLSRHDFNEDLKRTPGTDATGHGNGLLRTKNVIAIGQLALVVTMLITAGLFSRSAMNAVGANPGFEFGSNFIVRLDERATGDTEAQAMQLIREAGDRITALPGVESVSPAWLVPFGPARAWRNVWPGTAPPAPDAPLIGVTFNMVGMNYFRTLGLPLLRGREFNREEVETTNALLSVIINQKLAEQCWPGTDPLGQTLQVPPSVGGPDWRAATVVGVVPDVGWDILDKQRPALVYEPPAGHFLSTWNLHVRVAKGASASLLMDACGEALSSFGNRIPMPQIHTLTTVQRTSPQVLLMEVGGLLFAVLGTVAVVLSCLGVYGLKAYEMTRRIREIGIRMALGATAGSVLTMILVESAGLVLCGIGLGFLISLVVGRLTSRFLYQVLPFDPLTFVVIPAFLLAVALFACWLPARRAARVAPMTALRHE